MRTCGRASARPATAPALRSAGLRPSASDTRPLEDHTRKTRRSYRVSVGQAIRSAFANGGHKPNLPSLDDPHLAHRLGVWATPLEYVEALPYVMSAFLIPPVTTSDEVRAADFLRVLLIGGDAASLSHYRLNEPILRDPSTAHAVLLFLCMVASWRAQLVDERALLDSIALWARASIVECAATGLPTAGTQEEGGRFSLRTSLRAAFPDSYPLRLPSYACSLSTLYLLPKWVERRNISLVLPHIIEEVLEQHEPTAHWTGRLARLCEALDTSSGFGEGDRRPNLLAAAYSGLRSEQCLPSSSLCASSRPWNSTARWRYRPITLYRHGRRERSARNLAKPPTAPAARAPGRPRPPERPTTCAMAASRSWNWTAPATSPPS